MLRLSRFILCVLIVISFLYKSVCSSHEIENNSIANDNTEFNGNTNCIVLNNEKILVSSEDDPNFNWKNNNSKDLVTLLDLFNVMNDDNNDGSSYNHIYREPWIRSQRSPSQKSRTKRSINGDTSNELSEEILNYPLHQLNLGEIQKFPRVREFFIRNGNKRNLEFNPRLGRAVHNDDCVEIVRFRPPYAPRLGKKSVDNFSPRLGRHCSEFTDRRK